MGFEFVSYFEYIQTNKEYSKNVISKIKVQLFLHQKIRNLFRINLIKITIYSWTYIFCFQIHGDDKQYRVNLFTLTLSIWFFDDKPFSFPVANTIG